MPSESKRQAANLPGNEAFPPRCRPSLQLPSIALSQPYIKALFQSDPDCTISQRDHIGFTIRILPMTANRLKSNSLDRIRDHSRGFTLIELLATILVLVLLVTIALPSFQRFVISNRLSAQINELVGDLSQARGEAAARSQQVQMCIAASSTTCASSGNDWAAGRILWVDINRNGSLDGSTEILKYVPPLEGGVTLVATGPSSAFTITFLAYGGLAPGNSTWTFKLCSPGETKGRRVIVPLSGRAIADRIEDC